MLFPYLGEVAPESGPMIDELIQDHEQIRATASKLEAGAASAKLIFDLGDLLERHIRKEERELFPLFEQYADTEKAEAIGAAMKKIVAPDTAGKG